MLRALLASTRDDRAERFAIAKPCCARLENGAWCALPDGHEGRHLGFETEKKEPKKQ